MPGNIGFNEVNEILMKRFGLTCYHFSKAFNELNSGTVIASIKRAIE